LSSVASDASAAAASASTAASSSSTASAKATHAADYLEADRYIDKATTPSHWALVLIKKGTGALGEDGAVELLRQPLYDVDGSPLASTSTPRGRAVSDES
jgi:hypothetical protein